MMEHSIVIHFIRYSVAQSADVRASTPGGKRVIDTTDRNAYHIPGHISGV